MEREIITVMLTWQEADIKVFAPPLFRKCMWYAWAWAVCATNNWSSAFIKEGKLLTDMVSMTWPPKSKLCPGQGIQEEVLF